MHSFFDGNLGCFYVLAVVNSIAKKKKIANTDVFLDILIDLSFFGQISGLELLDHKVILFLIPKEISTLFSIIAASIYISVKKI